MLILIVFSMHSVAGGKAIKFPTFLPALASHVTKIGRQFGPFIRFRCGQDTRSYL